MSIQVRNPSELDSEPQAERDRDDGGNLVWGNMTTISWGGSEQIRWPGLGSIPTRSNQQHPNSEVIRPDTSIPTV